MAEPYIYIACPWNPNGGGMFKVADYLVQAQARPTPNGAARLRPLDTRGDRSALFSAWVLLIAIARIIFGRLGGGLVGVHVNMAERLSFVRKGMIVVTCRSLGLPVVLHLHAAQLHHAYRRWPAPLQSIARWVMARASVVVVLGEASRRFVVQEMRVPAERVEVLINGVPANVEARRVAGPGRRRMLFVGNLDERKGVSDLLAAVARCASARNGALDVLILGGGDVAGYEAKARALGVGSHVRFGGWADQSRLAIERAMADVLVLPSYDEGLPLVILEAMASGLAVICTPVGEIGSTFVDGRQALFVQPGDIDGIAAAIDRVLGDDRLRERLEQAGMRDWEERFSMERFFRNLSAIHLRTFGIAAAWPPDHASGAKPTPKAAVRELA